MSDNNPKYLSQALRLVQSLRWFGGQLATADFFVCIVDGDDAEYSRQLKHLGAQVRIVPRFDARQGTSNKLRFLRLRELADYDTVVMMDCDTVIVQDPLPHLNGEMFQAKMADFPTVSHEGFRRLFEHIDLPLPPQEFRCNPSGVQTIWYANSGLVIIQQPFVRPLLAAWERFTRALLDRLDLFENPWYCEQSCLALAYAANPVPFEEVGLNMNFPMHTPLRAGPEVEGCDPSSCIITIASTPRDSFRVHPIQRSRVALSNSTRGFMPNDPEMIPPHRRRHARPWHPRKPHMDSLPRRSRLLLKNPHRRIPRGGFQKRVGPKKTLAIAPPDTAQRA